MKRGAQEAYTGSLERRWWQRRRWRRSSGKGRRNWKFESGKKRKILGFGSKGELPGASRVSKSCLGADLGEDGSVKVVIYI